VQPTPSPTPAPTPSYFLTENPHQLYGISCMPGRYVYKLPSHNDVIAAGAISCRFCPDGRYQPEYDQWACKHCPSGRWHVRGGHNIETCDLITEHPTASPSPSPTVPPTSSPTARPTRAPTQQVTLAATLAPTRTPTAAWTPAPSPPSSPAPTPSRKAHCSAGRYGSRPTERLPPHGMSPLSRPSASMSITVCMKCPKGKFQPAQYQWSCLHCPRGKFSRTWSGSLDCVAVATHPPARTPLSAASLAVQSAQESFLAKLNSVAPTPAPSPPTAAPTARATRLPTPPPTPAFTEPAAGVPSQSDASGKLDSFFKAQVRASRTPVQHRKHRPAPASARGKSACEVCTGVLHRHWDPAAHKCRTSRRSGRFTLSKSGSCREVSEFIATGHHQGTVAPLPTGTLALSPSSAKPDAKPFEG
jgi:hypothetical protein